MKTLMIALLCATALLAASAAQAYTAYNYADQPVSVYVGNSHLYSLDSGTTHKTGARPDLFGIWVGWKTPKCHKTSLFNIPEGGSIKIYQHKVEVFDKKNKKVDSRPIERVDCRHFNVIFD